MIPLEVWLATKYRWKRTKKIAIGTVEMTAIVITRFQSLSLARRKQERPSGRVKMSWLQWRADHDERSGILQPGDEVSP